MTTTWLLTIFHRYPCLNFHSQSPDMKMTVSVVLDSIQYHGRPFPTAWCKESESSHRWGHQSGCTSCGCSRPQETTRTTTQTQLDCERTETMNQKRFRTGKLGVLWACWWLLVLIEIVSRRRTWTFLWKWKWDGGWCHTHEWFMTKVFDSLDQRSPDFSRKKQKKLESFIIWRYLETLDRGSYCSHNLSSPRSYFSEELSWRRRKSLTSRWVS